MKIIKFLLAKSVLIAACIVLVAAIIQSSPYQALREYLNGAKLNYENSVSGTKKADEIALGFSGSREKFPEDISSFMVRIPCAVIDNDKTAKQVEWEANSFCDDHSKESDVFLSEVKMQHEPAPVWYAEGE